MGFVDLIQLSNDRNPFYFLLLSGGKQRMKLQRNLETQKQHPLNLTKVQSKNSEKKEKK
jgi:hypothetical protein